MTESGTPMCDARTVHHRSGASGHEIGTRAPDPHSGQCRDPRPRRSYLHDAHWALKRVTR